MIVITTMSSKGGVGKTLISLILAQYLMKMDYKVCFLDIDGTKQAYGFEVRRKEDFGLPMTWDYKHTTDGAEIVEFIDHADEKNLYEIMIVDTPGHINELNIEVLSRADLTLIPIMDDASSEALAASTKANIRAVERTLRRKIPHAFVFSRVPHIGISKFMRKNYEEIEESGSPFIRTLIKDRMPYKHMIRGLMIDEMATKINGKSMSTYDSVKKAHVEGLAFTQEVIEMISNNGEQNE